MDYTVHGILQARILEWVAFHFSRDLPNPGIELRSPTLQVDSLPVEPQGKPTLEGKVLTTGPPGKSPEVTILKISLILIVNLKPNEQSF